MPLTVRVTALRLYSTFRNAYLISRSELLA